MFVAVVKEVWVKGIRRQGVECGSWSRVGLNGAGRPSPRNLDLSSLSTQPHSSVKVRQRCYNHETSSDKTHTRGYYEQERRCTRRVGRRLGEPRRCEQGNFTFVLQKADFFRNKILSHNAKNLLLR